MTRLQNRQLRIGLLITILNALLYGIWPSATRAVYADGGNAAFVVITAVVVRTLPVFITCLAQRQPLFRTRLDRKQALTAGFFQAVSSGAAFAAVYFLPGPLAVVIMFTHTLMLLCFMIWRGEIKPDAATLLTTLCALLGLVFVLDLMHKQSSGNLIGMALAFVSALALASRLYVIGHQTKTRHPAVVGAENFLVAIPFTLAILLWQRPETPHSLAGYGWMGLGSITLGLGTLGQFYAISLLGSFRYSLFLKLEPLFATIFAALLIGEYLKPGQYFGVVLVIGSLALYQLTDHSRRKAHEIVTSSAND